MQTYTNYVAAVSLHGITPVTEAQFNECQNLPRVIDVQMPHTLNYAIGTALEAGDSAGASNLINQCDEHDKECWLMYTTEGEHFPAGGLHFNQLQWSHFQRLEARPLNVAFMLDFDGSLPGDLEFFNIGKERFFFDEAGICRWDKELGWDFLHDHCLTHPTLEEILPLTKACFDAQSLAAMEEVYTANCGIRLRFTGRTKLNPLCELIGEALQKALKEGRIFVDDPRSDLVGRSDCTFITPVTAELLGGNMEVMFCFNTVFTECFSYDWIDGLIVPVILEALGHANAEETYTFKLVQDDEEQQVSFLRFYADWDFPEDVE